MELSRLSNRQLRRLLAQGEVRFASDKKAYIGKMKKLAEDVWADFYNLRQESFEGAGSRFDKENPLRFSPEAKKMESLIEDIYKKLGELKKVTVVLRKYED